MAKPNSFRQCLTDNKLPINLSNGAVTWTTQVETLDYSQFLPIMCSGVMDQEAEYRDYAYKASMDMLEYGIKGDGVLKALPQVVQVLKGCLNTRDAEIVPLSLKILQQLSVCQGVGKALVGHYRVLLPICNILKDNRLGIGSATIKDLITETLEVLEVFGGASTDHQIQHFVPGFQSCMPIVTC